MTPPEAQAMPDETCKFCDMSSETIRNLHAVIDTRNAEIVQLNADIRRIDDMRIAESIKSANIPDWLNVTAALADRKQVIELTEENAALKSTITAQLEAAEKMAEALEFYASGKNIISPQAAKTMPDETYEYSFDNHGHGGAYVEDGTKAKQALAAYASARKESK